MAVIQENPTSDSKNPEQIAFIDTACYVVEGVGVLWFIAGSISMGISAIANETFDQTGARNIVGGAIAAGLARAVQILRNHPTRQQG